MSKWVTIFVAVDFVGGLILMVVMWRRSAKPPEAPPLIAEPTGTQAIIRRVLGTQKLDRHEMVIKLLLEVRPPNTPAYEAEAAWVIRVGRIARIQLEQTVKVAPDPTNPRQIFPAEDWAKMWHEGYLPPSAA